MEFKGTKGEWKVEYGNSASVVIKPQNHYKPIASLSSYYCGKTETTFEELEANAQLIASAPELLQALQMVIDDADEDCSDIQMLRSTYNKCENAINKALGNESK